MIRDYGGIPQENVTKETDYLVVGYYRKNTLKSEKSNKRFLAERYISQGRKIRIIKEDEFLHMIWFSPCETVSGKCPQAMIWLTGRLLESRNSGGKGMDILIIAILLWLLLGIAFILGGMWLINTIRGGDYPPLIVLIVWYWGKNSSPSVLLSDYNRSYFIAIKLINIQREDEFTSFYNTQAIIMCFLQRRW